MKAKFNFYLAGHLTLLLALLAGSLQAQTDNSFCWMRSFTRPTTGTTGACAPGTSKEGALCYTTCQAGYESTPGALVCEQTCPAGYTDLPGTCTKPADIDSAGYPWQLGDIPLGSNGCYNGMLSRCKQANPNVGCYLSGLIAYPNCPANYHKNGDLICTANCPSGMKGDGGVFCSKQEYGRKVTVPSTCATGTDLDGALCYPSCGNGYTGVGPVCWGNCPSDHSYRCGAACAVSQSACQAAVGNMVLSTAGVALNVASMALGGPGLSTAMHEAMEAGTTGLAMAVLEHVPESGESVLFNAAKSYATSFGKQFVKTTLKTSWIREICSGKA